MNTNNKDLTAGGIDINKIVLEMFEKEFPGAPKEQIEELVQDVGKTILAESLAMLVEQISVKDEVLGYEVRSILEANSSFGQNQVHRINAICNLPHINIDMEYILKEVAIDVVKDILRK